MSRLSPRLLPHLAASLLLSWYFAAALRAENAVALYQSTLRGTVLVIATDGDETSKGSGWIVDRSNRLVVTSFHVVQSGRAIAVQFPRFQDGQIVADPDAYDEAGAVAGQVLDFDRARDLALLQVESLPDSAVALPVATQRPTPGEALHSVGNPGPLWVYTPGQVRSVYRLSEGPHDLRVIESNGATNPGDSGGPVVNSLGQVVGVTMGYHTEARLVSYSVDVIEVQRLLASVHGILQPQTAGDYVRRGKWAFARRNLAEAQSAFRRALELDAAAAEALVGQALVHVAQAEFDLAVEASDRALQLDRKSADAYLARGLAQLHEGNAERAAADLTEALRLGGESPLVLELRGDAWAASDELARAASDYWRARKLVPRESDLRRLDQKLEQLFNHVDARQANAAM